MVIDSHIHFGKVMNLELPEQDLIRYIYEYKVDYAIISNVSGIEFDDKMNEIDRARQYPQIQLNKRTADLVKEYPERLKGLCWIKPHGEGCTEEFERFVEEYKLYFCGIKVHPYHSAIKITDPRIIPYILLCQKFNWPCVIHSGSSIYAPLKAICQIAESYPDVKFIMVHMESTQDDTKIIESIKKLPNLYCDTTWMNPKSIVKTIGSCGSHKVLFGTHTVSNGVHTADQYLDMIEYLKTNLRGKELEDVFYKNAANLFRLEVKHKAKNIFY